MKKSGLLAAAVLLSFSAGVFAAGTDFDQSVKDVLDAVETLKAPPGPGHDNHGGFQPGPGHDNHGGPGFDNHGGPNIPQPPMPQQPQPVPQPPQPWHPQPGPGHDNHGAPGFDNHDGNHPGPGHDNNHPGPQPWHPQPGPDPWHPGPGPDPDWNHHNNPPYNGPTYECTDWTFKADTPNPFSDKIYFYDTQGQIHDQKVTIRIGQRDLKPWESEIITVCDGSLSQDKSLFNYTVNQKDTSGFGSFFTGTKSYEYTLTPTGRKTSAPDSQGLTMVSGGADQNNAVNITLGDKWASFYQGQQVTFNVKIMRLPDNVQGLSPQELIDALKEKTFSVSYPVSAQYQIRLFDQALPGTYMVTVDYARDGVNMDQIFSFKI